MRIQSSEMNLKNADQGHGDSEESFRSLDSYGKKITNLHT